MKKIAGATVRLEGNVNCEIVVRYEDCTYEKFVAYDSSFDSDELEYIVSLGDRLDWNPEERHYIDFQVDFKVRTVCDVKRWTPEDNWSKFQQLNGYNF